MTLTKRGIVVAVAVFRATRPGSPPPARRTPTTSTDTGAGTGTTSAGSDYDYDSLSGTLNGSGATFPKAFYQDAIQRLRRWASGVTVNYGGGGSGKRKTDLASNT